MHFLAFGLLYNDLNLGVHALAWFFAASNDFCSGLDLGVHQVSPSEPLEGVDSLDVLLDLNDSVHIRYPGFRHRFVRLYVIFSDDSCSRSTCRHVDPFKAFLDYDSRASAFGTLQTNLSKGSTPSTFF